ncbi:50S ribosomal protein L35 [soil metagenome]
MVKLKSNRGAAKRFKVTGSGGIKHRQGFRSHILTKKSSKRKRQLRSMKVLSDSDHKSVTRMLRGS